MMRDESMAQIRIVIVDDHPVFRQGLIDVLETDTNLKVIGQAASGEAAVELIYGEEPDVVLMDINLPDLNGLQVTRQIKSSRSDVKVIIVTGYDDVEQAFHAIRAGASAYCAKDITPESLIGSIYAVRDGLFVVEERKMNEDEVIQWVEDKIGKHDRQIMTDVEDSFVPLSPREMEILEYVTHGRSNKEIAYALGISHQTVKNHMTAILRKLQVDDRTQAAVYALSRGWVRLDKPLQE
jgi:DNA-binding NarL/FixJ family response regulator